MGRNPDDLRRKTVWVDEHWTPHKCEAGTLGQKPDFWAKQREEARIRDVFSEWATLPEADLSVKATGGGAYVALDPPLRLKHGHLEEKTALQTKSEPRKGGNMKIEAVKLPEIPKKPDVITTVSEQPSRADQMAGAETVQEPAIAVDLNGNPVAGLKYNPKTDILSTDDAPVVPYTTVKIPTVELKRDPVTRKLLYDPSYVEAMLTWFMEWKPVTVLWIEKTWQSAKASGVNRFPKIVGNPPPRIERFALMSLRCPPRMLREWAKEHPELEEALEMCHEIYRQAVMDGAILAQYNPTWAIFEAKNNLSMVDKQEVNHTGDATMIAQTAYAAQLASMDAPAVSAQLTKLLRRAEAMTQGKEVQAKVTDATFTAQYPVANIEDATLRDS